MDQKIIQELNDFTNQAMRDAMSDYTDLRAHYPLDLPFAGGIEMPRRVTGEKRDGTPLEKRVFDAYQDVFKRIDLLTKISRRLPRVDDALDVSAQYRAAQQELSEHIEDREEENDDDESF